MKHLAAGLLLAALLGPVPAGADESAPEAALTPGGLEVRPEQRGYAFDQPEILLRQRLFGLAHGVSLLAAACLDLPEHSESTQNAYARWHARQGKTIESLVRDLSGYYFGPRADEVQWRDLTRALNLKDRIAPSLGTVGLQEACTTLPAAIVRPRYELDTLLAATAATAATAAAQIDVTAALRPQREIGNTDNEIPIKDKKAGRKSIEPVFSRSPE